MFLMTVRSSIVIHFDVADAGIKLGTMAPIEREVRNLAIGLQGVKDEQEYIVVRERTHRNTAESTNDRVKWWSVFQTLILFAVCGWQVYYLKVGTLFILQALILTSLFCIVFLRSQACYLSLVFYTVPDVQPNFILLCLPFFCKTQIPMHAHECGRR